MVRKCLAICFAILLICSLAACGSQGESQSTPPPSGTVAPVEVPTNGGSIGIVMPQDPGNWNPLRPQTREIVDLYGLIYDGLVRFDEEMRPIPGLAQDWTTEDEGTTWKFKLRSDVVFHDGSALTTADVVKTLDLLKSYADNSRVDSIYEGVFDLIDSYSAEDETTLMVKVKVPGHRIISAMSFPILPRSYGGGDNLPAGTGPYSISSLEKGKSMVLSANANGWRRQPYISTINVTAVPDTAAALSSLDANLVNLVHSTLLTASRYRQKDLINTVPLMTQEYECIVPNVYRSAVSSPEMRKAILYAIDRGEIISSIYLSNAVLVDVPVTPDSYLYSSSTFTYEYSTARAQELLSGLGFADDDGDGYLEKRGARFKLNIMVNENPGANTGADAARLVATQLGRVGLRAEVSVLPWEEYTKALQNGNFDLAFCGFDIGKDFDVSFFLHSAGANNYSHYSSTQLNNLLDAYSGAVTESEIKQASLALQRYLVDELPVMSLYFRTNTLVYHSMIQGVTMARDKNVFKAVEQWYIYREGDDIKAGGVQ